MYSSLHDTVISIAEEYSHGNDETMVVIVVVVVIVKIITIRWSDMIVCRWNACVGVDGGTGEW